MYIKANDDNEIFNNRRFSKCWQNIETLFRSRWNVVLTLASAEKLPLKDCMYINKQPDKGAKVSQRTVYIFTKYIFTYHIWLISIDISASVDCTYTYTKVQNRRRRKANIMGLENYWLWNIACANKSTFTYYHYYDHYFSFICNSL